MTTIFRAMAVMGILFFCFNELFPHNSVEDLNFFSRGLVEVLRLMLLLFVAGVALKDILNAQEHKERIEFLEREHRRLTAQIAEESENKGAEPN